MSRRGNNIYKRKDGRWEGRVSKGKNEHGRMVYHSVYGHTYTEVKEKMLLLSSIEKNKKKLPKSLLLTDILNIWLKDKRLTWKESTYSCYRQLADRQIIPDIGNMQVSFWNQELFNHFAVRKKNSGCVHNGKQLSGAYVRNICGILAQALYHMNKTYGYDIPVPDIPVFSAELTPDTIPCEDDLKRLENYLLKNLQDTTCLGILLSLFTGIRIGELCALQWKDIDFQDGILHVSKTLQRMKLFDESCNQTNICITTPKTRRSIRDIPIPYDILNILEKRKGSGEEYIVKGKKALFAEPRTIQYRFAVILGNCGIKAFNFHKLRHVFATRCISLAFDPKNLSEILGHSNIQVTLNLYVHASNSRKHLLMNLLSLKSA